MTPDEIRHLALETGRLSAALFVVALVSARLDYRPVRLWLGFVAVQTIHFAIVVWLAAIGDGSNLFPGNRSLQDVGGWPTVMGIFAFNYLLDFIALAGRSAGRAAGRRLRIADRIATTLMGLNFLATYIPLISSSVLFVLPVMVLVGALAVFLMCATRNASGGAAA